MWIHIICGAGASSTFVARRLEKAAAAAGLTLHATAGSVGGIDTIDGEPDLVLLGAHLASHEAEVAAAHPSSRVAILAADAAQDFDGSRTLAFVLQRIEADSSSHQKGTS